MAYASIGPDVRVDADLVKFRDGGRPTGVSVAELMAQGHDRSATFGKLREALDVSGAGLPSRKQGACPLPVTSNWTPFNENGWWPALRNSHRGPGTCDDMQERRRERCSLERVQSASR